MWKKILSLTLFMLFYCVSAYSLSYSEYSYSEEAAPASQEIEDIANNMLSMADRWEEQQNLSESLTQDLENVQTELVELKMVLPNLQQTIGKMQSNYEHLHKDYLKSQVTLKRWKTTSIVLGVSLGVSLVITVIILAMK